MELRVIRIFVTCSQDVYCTYGPGYGTVFVEWPGLGHVMAVEFQKTPQSQKTEECVQKTKQDPEMFYKSGK